MLLRKHADIAAHDQEVWQSFVANNFGHADEHYIVSLLLAWGEQPHLDCVGGVTYVDWQHREGAHPFTFTLPNITDDLFRSLRATGSQANSESWVLQMAGSCEYTQALKYATTTRAPELMESYAKHAIRQSNGGNCPLFARKFSQESAAVMYNLAHTHVHSRHAEFVAQ